MTSTEYHLQSSMRVILLQCFSGTRLYLCIYNQPSWATLSGNTKGLQYSLVVTSTSRRSICYPYSWHPSQAQAPLNLSVTI